jgi:hypothetical protein
MHGDGVHFRLLPQAGGGRGGEEDSQGGIQTRHENPGRLGGKHIDSEKKYYIADPGLKNAREHFRQNDLSHIMENIIYNELRCRGYDVDVGSLYRTESEDGKRKRIGCEVDFVANRGNTRVYIQSAYHMDVDVQKREKRPYLSMKDSFRKIIISMDGKDGRYDEDGVESISLIGFLMDPDSI